MLNSLAWVKVGVKTKDKFDIDKVITGIETCESGDDICKAWNCPGFIVLNNRAKICPLTISHRSDSFMGYEPKIFPLYDKKEIRIQNMIGV